MHEAIGIVAGVLPTRETGHPVRREELQRLPTFGSPALADAPALQQHVVAACVREQVADSEAGLAGAHDDRVGALHGRLLETRAAGLRPGRAAVRGQTDVTSIATGTPFVSTSKTAERARDCSTISATFAAGASASMVKAMRICS